MYESMADIQGGHKNENIHAFSAKNKNDTKYFNKNK